MKNVLRISALLTAALMVFVMVGCGGDEEEGDKDTTAPSLVSSNPASGSNIAANGTVSMVFSEAMKEVTVAGAAGTVALAGDGKSAVWTPTGEIPVGSTTLTINGSDKAGNALAAATVALTVKVADKTPPDIDAANSSPANGATAVDPASVTKIVITFTEAMSEAKLDSFEPKDAKVDSKFDGSKTLTISFLGGYKLSNEMEIIATVSGKDGAGNALATTKYTFTTMKKEE
jgi:hypothetical protein